MTRLAGRLALILAAGLLFAWWIATPALNVVSIGVWRVVGLTGAGVLGVVAGRWIRSPVMLALCVAAGIFGAGTGILWFEPNQIARGLANTVLLAVKFFWVDLLLFPAAAGAGGWLVGGRREMGVHGTR